jgi:hypothetical protein
MIVYFLISKKSSPLVKRAALIALILLILSLALSALFIVNGSGTVSGPLGGAIPEEPAAAAVTDPRMILIIAVIILFFIALIAYVAWQDARGKRVDTRS